MKISLTASIQTFNPIPHIMCFILATTNLQPEHISRLKDEWFFNSDGAGFACYRNNLLYSRKGYFKWHKLAKALRPLIGSRIVVHLRNATHGVISEENCHPFQTCQGSAFMAHNGILPAPFSIAEGISDTKRMADLLFSVTWEALESSCSTIERVIGYNKLVFINTDGKVLIVNPEYGTWLKKKETWISAKAYKPKESYNFTKHVTYVNGKKVENTSDAIAVQMPTNERYYRDLEAQAEEYVTNLHR